MMFVSPDTLIPDPYNPLDWNRYLYARANPVNATDPTGHSACWDDNANDSGCKQYTPTGTGLKLTITYDRDSKPATVMDKAMKGDLISIIDVAMPSHLGIRLQGEISLPAGSLIGIPILGWSGDIGVNLVYNGPDHRLASNLDVSTGPGLGAGGGGSATAGVLIGWGSSNVEDATSGNSVTVGLSGAAGPAAAVSASAPLEPNSTNLHVDQHYGLIPATLYIGGGAGLLYGGGGGGAGTTLLRSDLTYLLPNWSIFNR